MEHTFKKEMYMCTQECGKINV